MKDNECIETCDKGIILGGKCVVVCTRNRDLPPSIAKRTDLEDCYNNE